MIHGTPLAIDLYCGLGGWAEGLLAEGWRTVGFDIEQHDYGTGGYPGQLVLQDVTTLHGSQFKDASLIVASPPCQAYSYRAMPWKRAKALPPPDNTLFDACFRIQREACEAAGRYIPLIVENVRGAIKWVSHPVKWHFGSYYLWGDVPALMPMTLRSVKSGGRGIGQVSIEEATGFFHTPKELRGMVAAAVNGGIPIDHRGGRLRDWDGTKIGESNGKRWDERPTGRIAAHREGTKTIGHANNWSNRELRGQDFTRIAGKQAIDGVKQPGISGERNNGNGDKWFQDGAVRHGSKSNSRKAASAMIAKIPFPLAQHIARTFKELGS